ncbi:MULTISPECIES: sigma-Y antisigma factor component [Pontibacillus]|uniref:Sigma-Y antisigma factor component n=1 Tax=Pontibacillus chungwhensis TaxID=265426 RepID=A0ABY8UT06_9BACI|nr:MULTISPECIES: sigma-Y antisigma factor component [Pontibacillus]MCD5322948.1 sigma-Y antisigma factor component [Pontibacillus sp. HN14]WIF96343.1 sigma-Y antisigma factor component [Pontibacillus chungwhensis]
MTQVEPTEVPVFMWCLIVLLLVSQSTFLFIQAKKIHKTPWFWAIVGLIQVPMPTVAFYLMKKLIWEKKR